MTKKIQTVEDYLSSLTEPQKEWAQFFVNYMRKKHPQLKEVISFQMPTYLCPCGGQRNYIAFSVAKNHFTMHSLDFKTIEVLKEKLQRAGKGKGCVHAYYDNVSEREVLIFGIETILQKSQDLS